MRRPPLTRTTIIVAMLAIALSGCGRKGSPEPPGTVEAPGSAPTVFGTSEPQPPAAPPAQSDDPFILDPLI